jgi:hypothetical protein
MPRQASRSLTFPRFRAIRLALPGRCDPALACDGVCRP